MNVELITLQSPGADRSANPAFEILLQGYPMTRTRDYKILRNNQTVVAMIRFVPQQGIGQYETKVNIDARFRTARELAITDDALKLKGILVS